MTATPALPGASMDRELHSQPDVWRAALDLAERGVFADVTFPGRGASVAVIGCGTSWFVAQAYAALREDNGYGPTDAYTPTEMRLGRTYDAYVLISRSGTTTEVAELIDSLPDGAHTIAVVGVADSPIAHKATQVIDLGFADEESVVQTRFATTALMALRTTVEDLDYLRGLPASAQAALEEEPEDGLVNAEQYTFLGSRFALGLAQEAALKMRESSQAWTESYNSMEYRHGPIAIAAPGRIVWALSEVPEGLADQVAATGASLITHGEDPLVELVRLHKVALETSRARGLDADAPRSLTRSVILDK
ncbi:SIS domain-containing protein [Corynebacterium liangguodongii]|uniref:Sugar isomerase n=1 Tax=Corynebacterium liangguodongii TaxID=2079535 RepID=A0A2S0WC22_9CORY|nr:SIS domain-containing protein [Corynebacterium liangguodongii]AWB83308.1 sugar isomerase [Corynebacterium liangguodongii]PWC00602.1 SIS domain-containing protein [Corynebacterium liangguodongii]